MKTSITGSGGLAVPANLSSAEGDPKKSINVELWQACAGPLVNLPAAGTHVVYFPQGHSEQVAASMKKDMDAQVPNYPNLPSKLLCVLHSITLHADPVTDEVYTQMTLQPVSSFDKDALLRSDLSMRANKSQMEFFCKTLTASDTSTHGGFSVPRRAAEKIFPSLDFTMQPPAQELVARDLHDSLWTFRHIYRGQPKRHLLTTGWSLFVSGKRLIAGDSVLFIRDEKQQLLLGIRRANRQPTNLSSSVLSSDSMHIGILAAAAHAAANNSPFTVFYNPRASPSEFVIPLAKYYKAACSNQISLGMRFRMMFETEESGTRRYMGTIAGISDLDPIRWKNSLWRNLQVGWDESTAGEKRNRASIWEIEPVTAPFFICPTSPFFCSKHPRQPGMPDDDPSDLDVLFRRAMPWLGDDFGLKDPQALPGLSLAQWMNVQQHSSLANSMQPNFINPLPTPAFQNLAGTDSRQLGLPVTQHNNLELNAQRQNQPAQDQLQKIPSSSNPVISTIPVQQQLSENTQWLKQNLVSQNLSASLSGSPVSAQVLQSQGPSQNILQQQQSLLDQHLWRNMTQTLPHQQQQTAGQNLLSPQPVDHVSQQLHMPDSPIQLQFLQKLQQQNSLLAHQSGGMPQASQLSDAPKELLDIPPNFSRPVTANQMRDTSQPTSSFQQMVRNNSQSSILYSSPQQSKPPKQQQSGMLSESHGLVRNSLNPLSKQLSAGNRSLLTGTAGGGPSAVTEDAPSCSTSPSSHNFQNAPSSVILLYSSGQEPMSSNSNLVKEFPPKFDVRPFLNISKGQNQGFAAQMYPNTAGGQIDYLDSSSSVTSVLSQNDAQVPQNNNSMSFNSQSILFRDVSQEIEVHGTPSNNSSFGTIAENKLEMAMISDPLMTRDMVGSTKDFSTNLSSGGGMLPTYEISKEAQPDFSSSMISQSFGVPDITFNSIDSTINDSSFMNRGSWAPPQVPRMRTYTKVYKRGAVGRSIDITRYAGYNELKQDLARRFGIEGQLEDRQRIGWKLIYVDHENDVLLVGDDPWEEFVSCVRCIKILSPQEVQQMSLDGDIGRSVIPNQACTSSDNGLSWNDGGSSYYSETER